MSIIIGVVSRRGIVGSDGRRFAPSQLIDRDDFDKTFSVDNDLIIGAFCGLVEFGGQTVGQHVQEIASVHLPLCASFEVFLDKIQEDFKSRLMNIDPLEVGMDHRNVDLILIGGRQLSVGDMGIGAIRFQSKNSQIEVTREILYPDGFLIRCKLFGDDSAQQGARVAFNINQSRATDIDHLDNLTRGALASACRRASTDHLNQAKCGGRIFTRKTRRR